MENLNYLKEEWKDIPNYDLAAGKPTTLVVGVVRIILR